MNDKPDAAAALTATAEHLIHTGHTVTLRKIFAFARHPIPIVQGEI
jgi:hypothetical protein